MTNHVYPITRPLAAAPVHEDLEGNPVTVAVRGTTYRKGEPVGYIYLAEPAGLVGPLPDRAVSGLTVAELDELDQWVAAEEAYEAGYAAATAAGTVEAWEVFAAQYPKNEEAWS